MVANERDWICSLVDGICPEWAVFVNVFSNESDPRKKQFVIFQEQVQKDIECAFGVSVLRFHILKRLFRGWHVEDLTDIIQCCAIIHNVIAVNSKVRLRKTTK